MEVKPIVPSSKAHIMIVGEAPGEVELACGMPFTGTDGTTLKKILTQANIFYGDCIITNVARIKIRKQFQDKKRTIPTPEFQEQMNILADDIRKYNPNVVVALGVVPLAVLCGVNGIKTFRGTILESSLVPGKKVIPTYHPKAVNFEWKLFYQTVMDMRKARHESTYPDIPRDNRQLVVAPKKHEIVTYLNWLYEHKDTLKIAIDLEHVTPGAHISWLGISHDPDYAMSIQFLHNRAPCFPETDEVEIWSLLTKLFSSSIPQIYHNASYDVMNLWHNQGVWCENVVCDTMLAAHTLWPEFPKDLGYLSSILLSVPAWKHTGGAQYEHGAYNAADAANTRALYEPLMESLEKDDYYKKTFLLEMSQLRPAGFMQLQGVCIDVEEKAKLQKEFSKKMKEIQEGLSKIMEKEINFSSPKQMQELLYVDMGLPVQYKRRKNATQAKTITTDADALEKLYIKTRDPVLKLILEHRKYSKILQFININLSPDQRVHTSYNIGGTDTGRWSSSKSIILDYGSGNLQSIDRRIRSMYRSPSRRVLLQADYIGAEAHVVAHLIQDHRIIQAFDNGEDVHKLTASFMFNVPVEDVTPELRRVGKTIRHGTNYSMGPGILAKNLGEPLAVGKRYLQQFHAITPQLKAWHTTIRNQLSENRTLKTPLGRKRIFMGRWGDQLFRSAYAFIPQSTVGDLLNTSLVSFYEEHKEAEDMAIYMQLHDAIYIYCPENDVMYWAEQLHKHMTRPISLPHTDLYIGVDFKVGINWKDMEKLEVLQ